MIFFFFEADCGAREQSVTKRYWLWVRSPLEEMKYLLKFYMFISSLWCRAWSFTNQNVKPPEFGGKWGTKCPNTSFPLLTPLSVVSIMKLIYFFSFFWKQPKLLMILNFILIIFKFITVFLIVCRYKIKIFFVLF